MFKENFPVGDREMKEQLIQAAEKFEPLKGERVSSTEVDESGEVTIVFESGRKLCFNITDEDFFKADRFEIK